MNPDSVPKFYYVYVLRSQRNSRWYVGFTMDLRKRFKEHNEGKYNSWTLRRPFIPAASYGVLWEGGGIKPMLSQEKNSLNQVKEGLILNKE
ncbi:MAG: GIY-YIG nuclease family protein [Candidatus Sungiibacteriota bacterium]|uniref:GIY-YIG nuclease family protein n=1 Tax=Candidatus Sungiibacteriota bacterium TaxID=2750080 RepID=A0A7T5UPQ8_9BACT|nr:MAG: GIY-YIG nuclease family protein [Candidatus Sungbacteria bacterium]